MASTHKIALIGGSGFIGTRLTGDLLNAGHAVKIADIAPSTAYPDLRADADVRDYETLLSACAGCDLMINLAAAHRDDVRPVSLYYDTNVAGARMSCAVADQIGITTIVFTSSVAVYGHQHGEPDEQFAHAPINPYGETKSQAEDVYRDWVAQDPARRTLIIIRPTVVFGPTNRGNVHTLMDQISKGNFLMIGDGENKKSMAYVGNVSAFIVHAISTLRAGEHVFNYVDKPDFSMNRLIGLIRTRIGKPSSSTLRLPKIIGLGAGSLLDLAARVSGKTFPISRIRIEKFCATTVFKADRVAESGFVAPTSLEDALIQTIDAEFNALKSPESSKTATAA